MLMAHTARSVDATLKDALLGNTGDRSHDALANALRNSVKIVVLTQAAYDALGSSIDANTIYITTG
jgi:hypothetical protein